MKLRIVIYVAVLAFATILDTKTAFGPAEWLIEVVLAWVATAFGSIREMIVVAAAATASILAGVWTSPASETPMVAELLNRLAAAAFIWLLVYTARRRRLAEAEVKVLRGLLPICAACKRIRRKDDAWETLETYITDHSEAAFTHSLCPECFQKYYSELEKT